jgi:Tfp pilus assembly protein PilO
MGLSKRERIIVLVTILCVGALVGDKLVRAPLASGWEQLKSDRQELAAQVAKAKNLLERQSQLEKSGTLSAGLLSDAETESGVAKALDKWAQDARLALTSVKPDRMASGDKGLKEILFVIAGTGSLDAVAWFLYQVETSELPIKVKYMQVGSTSESGSSMTLELRLSALYLAADEKSSPKQSQPKQKETKNEEQLL